MWWEFASWASGCKTRDGERATSTIVTVLDVLSEPSLAGEPKTLLVSIALP